MKGFPRADLVNVVGRENTGAGRYPDLECDAPVHVDHRYLDVLYNPNAIAVSGRIRARLTEFAGIELLPIAIEGNENFYLLNVTASVEPTPEFSTRRAPPPSGNIVEVYEFPASFIPAGAFFRVRQPSGSAGGCGGYCVRAIYANEAGARAIEAVCSGYLNASVLHHDLAIEAANQKPVAMAYSQLAEAAELAPDAVCLVHGAGAPRAGTSARLWS